MAFNHVNDTAWLRTAPPPCLRADGGSVRPHRGPEPDVHPEGARSRARRGRPPRCQCRRRPGRRPLQVWGTSPQTGFDCSGLTLYSYARIGKYLPRTAQQQYKATIRVRRTSLRSGDLVFFFTGRTAYHVGIYAGNWYIYEAPYTGLRVRKVWIRPAVILFGRVR